MLVEKEVKWILGKEEKEIYSKVYLLPAVASDSVSQLCSILCLIWVRNTLGPVYALSLGFEFFFLMHVSFPSTIEILENQEEKKFHL